MFANSAFNPYMIGRSEAGGEPIQQYCDQNNCPVHGQAGDGMARRIPGGFACAGQRQFAGGLQHLTPTQSANNGGDATGGYGRPPAYGPVCSQYAYPGAMPNLTNGLLNYRDGRFPSGYGCGYIDAGDLNVENIGYGQHMTME